MAKVAKVTWLGEGEDGPKETEWGGKTFKVGEAVEVEDPEMVEKARNNRFFKVTGGEKDTTETVEHVPPSQQGTSQGPAAKGGEPTTVTGKIPESTPTRKV